MRPGAVAELAGARLQIRGPGFRRRLAVLVSILKPEAEIQVHDPIQLEERTAVHPQCAGVQADHLPGFVHVDAGREMLLPQSRQALMLGGLGGARFLWSSFRSLGAGARSY